MGASFNTFVNLIFLFLILIDISCQFSLLSEPTYNAGVVELEPAMEGIPKERVKRNVEKMKKIIESDATKDLDILVFPENVLNNKDWKTYVPDAQFKIAPCDVPDYDFSLVELSCAARSRKLYLVINLTEKEYCGNRTQNCDPSGFNTYNTNVVLDRQGRVISRYRKSHLYGNEWYSTNVMANPENIIFTTDFGVTFGHFICFDMLFYSPAMTLINELNITDIIYPTYWFSELPFLTAVQVQEGWAFANNVNLLAADGSYPAGKNTGSGIFAGKHGRLVAAIYEEPTTILLTAKVPKRGSTYQLPSIVQPVFQPQLETLRFTKLALLRDYNVDLFETILLNENFTNESKNVCYKSFCCSFEVQRTLIQESPRHTAYRYRLAAYNGNQTTMQRKDQSDLSICAIIACTNDQLYSCGYIYPQSTLVGNKYYFNKINIQGIFRQATRRLIMPSTVDAQMMPVSVSMWTMEEFERANNTEVKITLNSPKADILTFGLWANYYTMVQNTHNLNPIYNKKAIKSASDNILTPNILIVLISSLLFFTMKFKC